MSSSPPVTPTPISDLISRYEKGLIAIPEFQIFQAHINQVFIERGDKGDVSRGFVNIFSCDQPYLWI